MLDAYAIFHNTCRIMAVVMAGVATGGWLAGNVPSLGFFLAAALVLAELFVLTLTVDKMSAMLAAGVSGGLGLLVLQGRFLITVLGLWALSSSYGPHVVAAGLVSSFVAYTLAAIQSATLQLAAPMETM